MNDQVTKYGHLMPASKNYGRDPLDFHNEQIAEARAQADAANHLMQKAHDDHCACEQSRAALVHTLTVIAEACEENASDERHGHEVPSLAEFCKATAARAREAITRASTPSEDRTS